ncbi:DUF1014 domain protein [Nadsonia fulvescens var. elongata DSM 6958]|uniref:DUF1014 domain protein n=1 Tax=Nadsonia fulvescens var. elongata DSM 6958 TaxID=857566 RepID=A0A1E3PNF6_9ASCO|nr:DUF1014 domain protein [Nadsonia fulvescens var. elongata DSM 6958]
MGKSKGSADTSKKAMGNARKADAASKKQAEEQARLDALEAADWENGAKKGGKKKESDAEKKAEVARKKAERAAELAAEEALTTSKPLNNKKRGAEKIAAKKTGKIDDFMADFEKESNTPEYNVTGLDNALDALSLTKEDKSKLDRHPERRFKAAYAAFEERRLPQLKEEHKGLRLNQMKELIKKEFEKSPENPFNQVYVAHNASKDLVAETKAQIRDATEKRILR